MFGPRDLFVSPAGRDDWSGRFAEPAADASDGPLATLSQAQLAVRRTLRSGSFAGPSTVWIRGGVYDQPAPLTFGPEDSAPITYASYPGETPVLDGSVVVTEWRMEAVHGRECWVAELPEVAAGRWFFRQLFVNGERRYRARWPKQGFCRFTANPDLREGDHPHAGVRRGVCDPADFPARHNLADVDLVVLHYWIDEHVPVASFDERTGLLEFGKATRMRLTEAGHRVIGGLARFYVEHVFEALTEPGEWYLDRVAGRLYYLPVPGETPAATEVRAPVTDQLLRVVGTAQQPVEFLAFRGLTFRHTDAALDDGEVAAASQAASTTRGVIYFEHARHCALEDGVVERVGWYAVELAEGCHGQRVVGNTLRDLGGGGVKIHGAAADGPRAERTGHNRITDNEICDNGRVFHAAVGILAQHTCGNTIAHNHIHDLYYSAISVGWVWGYAENAARDNRIEFNHIHDLGSGWLSDMGGIYTLGVQPGTVIRNNLIHDITMADYGGWAIYPDEGSSHIVVEDNVCYRTSAEPYHQHYGRENIVRNNIFAFGALTQNRLGRREDHLAFTLERNIFLTDGRPIHAIGRNASLATPGYRGCLNLFWDVSGPVTLVIDPATERPLDLAAWQALGHDVGSAVADPGLADPANGDFTLAPDSPALALGFKPIDLSRVGPRPAEEWD